MANYYRWLLDTTSFGGGWYDEMIQETVESRPFSRFSASFISCSLNGCAAVMLFVAGATVNFFLVTCSTTLGVSGWGLRLGISLWENNATHKTNPNGMQIATRKITPTAPVA
mmetsp:Transcript_16563/g.24788  ORF Transcript_16563/g.24788 Transcript_16563/m.24788 type:complete len:112 (-) Transcript_16563:101-436(-)